MASTARIDELKKKFDENPRRYFAPLANEFRKAGDIEQAIIICEEFLPQQPGHMSGHIVYGQALFEAGKLPESRGVFETALDLDPENLIALRHLGDIASSQGDHPAARGWYARVLDADPRNDEIQAVIATLDAAFPPVAAPPEPTSRYAPPPLPEHDLAPQHDSAEVLDLESLGPPPIPADLSLLDTQPAGVPVVAFTPGYTGANSVSDIIDGFSAQSFVPQPETESLMPELSEMAEGLESTSFVPPDEPVATTPDLDSSLESGIPFFEAPSTTVEAVEGLQGSGGHAQYAAMSFIPLPPLDLDDGLGLPPQGDPLAASMDYATPEGVPQAFADDDELLPEFEMPGEPAVSFTAPEPRSEAESSLVEREAAHVESETTFVSSDGDIEHVPAADYGDDGPELLEPADDFAPDAHEVVDETTLEPVEAEAAYDTIPMELPPAVISAEAELMDADQPPPTVTTGVEAADIQEADVEAPETLIASAPFLTETMAELYVAQGFRDRAHEVYAQLAASNPSDERLRGLADSFAEEAALVRAGPTARDFFARLASRRPANRAAAAEPPTLDDFAPIGAAVDSQPPADVPYSVDEAEARETPVTEADGLSPQVDEAAIVEQPPQQIVSSALERSAKMRTPNGSIDALFGNRVPGTSEDSAAAALAQAFGGVTEGPLPAMGRPAHAASGELTLDSVFRDGPARTPRPSQSFSFDQFFTGSPGGSSSGSPGGAPSRPSGELAAPGEPPAEKSADDIEQFNTWLQGLKPQ